MIAIIEFEPHPQTPEWVATFSVVHSKLRLVIFG
jgi:hypothetical protein